MKTFKELLEGVIQPNGTDKIKVEELDENTEALKEKSKKSGVSLSVLKKVYARGVAAWNSGHRPGTTPQQWGMARVNSYITKGKGTYHGADKDLREEEIQEDSRLEKKGYHSGLSASTAKARVAHWKKMDKLSDKDPRSYEPAPGDKTAKTKPSVHTKKYHELYGEETVVEGKMAQLHADIEDHLGKHVANYKKMGGAEHLGNKTVEVAKKLAKLHNISHEAAQKHVNDYVDHNLKESDASWAASQEKKKEDKLTSKDKGTLGKIHDLMAKEKAKKEFDLKMKKAQNSQRVAKALGEESINEAHVVHVSDGSKYDEEPHEQDVKHVNDGVKKHGGKFDGHSDKGAFFKFGSHADAENFRRHVNASPKKTVHADHLDESVNEAVDKEHPIYKEYQSLKKQPLKDLKDQIKRQHRVIDTSEFRSKEHAVSHILHNKHGAHRMKAVFGEETELDEAYRLPSDSEIDKVKAHVKVNHPNKSLAQVAVHKQTKKIEYVVKDKEGKMSGHTLGEEAEQIDEISKDTLHSYIHKAFAQGNDLHYDLAHSRGDKATDAERKALQAKISKRNTGIMKAGKKLREDVSMLSFEDYLKEQKACKKEELHPNQKKLDKNNNGKLDSDDFVKLRAGKTKEVDEKYVSDAQRKAVWASKNEKGVKEEAELDEAMTPMQKLKDALDRHSEKAVAANKAGDHEAVKVHQGYMNKIKTKMGKLAKNEEVDLQEMEELCEISKATLGSYVKKASTDAAKREVRIDRAMDASGSNYNEPSMQKALNKNAKRFAGISKAADKLAKEETEQIDEISKSTLGSYVKKASNDAVNKMYSAGYTDHMSHTERSKGNDALAKAHSKHAGKSYSKSVTRLQGIRRASERLAKEEAEQIDELSKNTLKSYQSKIGHDLDRAMDAMPHGTGDDKEDRKLNNRMVGDERAQKRLMKKEETDVITFKDLMQNISEAKIDDLKDKLAARKATQSAYDKDYKPAAKSNVQKVKGHSYGAGEEEGEDDEDTKKVSKPAAPEVKRGRGRPAGSKSGARN